MLNGLNHENSAVKWSIYILGVRKCRNKYMLTYKFFYFCTFTEGTISPPVWKMSPISAVPLWAKLFSSFWNKTFQELIFEKIHITESYIIKFLVNIWNHGKTLQYLSGENPHKMVNWCNSWSFIMIIMIKCFRIIIILNVLSLKIEHEKDYSICKITKQISIRWKSNQLSLTIKKSDIWYLKLIFM